MKLLDFLAESNEIEGYDLVREEEAIAAERFLELKELQTADVCNFVKITTNAHGTNGILRTQRGMDVMVGGHYPPKGGPEVAAELGTILSVISHVKDGGRKLAWSYHCAYEMLHPYTDGNGRSGRLIWLWMMGGMRFIEQTELPFLQIFYYQTLQNSR